MNKDKKAEYLRYDTRAKAILASERLPITEISDPGSFSVPPVFRAPYLYYEECINKYVKAGQRVLELGSGVGTQSRSSLFRQHPAFFKWFAAPVLIPHP